MRQTNVPSTLVCVSEEHINTSLLNINLTSIQTVIFKKKTYVETNVCYF
jgi:hypothetical protein